MNLIKDKKHISIVISSLYKIFNQVEITGKLNIKDIYYLNIIYSLLKNDMLELNNSQYNKLLNTYNEIVYRSNYICKPIIMKTYQTTPKPKFEQAEVKDCNNINTNPRIIYWQETYGLTDSQIIDLLDDLSYINDKPYDSYANFEIGKLINYISIGKICFLALDSKNTDTFIIKDSLNNDVTHTFNKIYFNNIKGTLFISQNVYSISNMEFKIIKE